MNPTTVPMQAPRTETRSRKMIWSGRILSGFVALFLAVDAAMKLIALPPIIEATVRLGYPAQSVTAIGLLLAISLAIYLIPRTAIIGAVLLTGYLGGAIATHVRVGSPLFSATLFPVYVAAMVWTGLWLRDRRVDAILTSLNHN